MLNIWIIKGCWNVISEYLKCHVYGCQSGYGYRFEFVGYGDKKLETELYAFKQSIMKTHNASDCIVKDGKVFIEKEY